MQTDRCTPSCAQPCAKDHRTKREKIEAMLGSGTTPGEQANARAALKRISPPKKKAIRVEYTSGTSNSSNSSWSFGQTRVRTHDRVLTAEELRKMYEDLVASMGGFQAASWQDQDAAADFGRASEAMNFAASQAQLCTRLGKHDWVHIGWDMFHTGEIRRCLRCGAYDPPRPKRKGSDGT